jgi:formate-nitrite transporter family protein
VTEGERGEENPADTGDATKPAATILRQEISVGTEQLERSASGLLLSAVSAGLDIGFGPLMVVAVLAIAPDEAISTRFMVAFVYAIGFVIVILGRSELFTEHTALAILPYLSGEASLAQVARLWGLVYAGNVAGVVAFSLLAAPLGTGLGLFGAEDAALMSGLLLDHGWWVMFGSAVAAGWLMGLVSWLVTAARDTVGQIVIILLITGAISVLGLHHSIAGSVEVLIGVLAADASLGDWIVFLAASTLGNALGGIVFVALIKYGHVARTGLPGDARVTGARKRPAGG